jgi:fructose-1,6-bisphosphatase/inositol monophosphatase family enzyme
LTIDHRLADRVTVIVQDVVASVVMPSFRALRPEDIHLKDTPGDPEDLVTIVDKAAERLLVEALADVVPGAAFIGEEAVSENPALLAALSAPEPVWLIDPIDGTKNFARGQADFGVMLALVERGVTRASWIAVPAAQPAGFVVAAQLGGGTRVDDSPVRMTRQVAGNPRGTLHTRMMPADGARGVVDALRGKYDVQPSTGAAATEYSAVLRGAKDFVIYYRLLPWDHAPGALALTEAGGAAVHLSGEPYTPLSPNQITIFAATPELAGTVRRWLTRGEHVSVSR